MHFILFGHYIYIYIYICAFNHNYFNLILDFIFLIRCMIVWMQVL
jgi:hypothetical protein